MARTSSSEIIDHFLVGIAAAGAIGLSIIAPNSLVALEKPLEKLITGADKRRDAKRIAKYLKQQKLVTVSVNEDGSYQVTLDEKGFKRSKRASFEYLEISKRKWDKKWRIIMFDIPEQNKATRDYLTRHMKSIGFKQLQKSVFIFPYAVDEFIAILFDTFPEIKKHVVYVVAEDLSNHNHLVKQFKSILN